MADMARNPLNQGQTQLALSTKTNGPHSTESWASRNHRLHGSRLSGDVTKRHYFGPKLCRNRDQWCKTWTIGTVCCQKSEEIRPANHCWWYLWHHNKGKKIHCIQRRQQKTCTIGTCHKNARTILGAKLLFATIPYAHIQKHNNFEYNCVKCKGKGICISPPPVTHNRIALEEEVHRANAIIEEEGTSQNLPATKLEQALVCNSSEMKNRSKRQKVRTKVISYSHMYNGFHADAQLKKRWCIKIANSARQTYNNFVLASSQG